MELELVRKDGGVMSCELAMHVLRSEAGALSGFTGLLRDLSAQRLAEAGRRARVERLSALAVTQRDVTQYGLELAVLLPRIANRARELTGAQTAILERRAGREGLRRAVAGDAALDTPLGALVAPHGSATMGARLRSLRYDDLTESPDILADACDRMGVSSLLAVPILHERATIGWLAALSQDGAAFGGDQAATLELMATLIGGPLAQAQTHESRRLLVQDRVRAQAAQRESEARFRTAMDASLDALLIAAAIRDGRGEIVDFAVLDVNRSAESMFALGRETLLGARIAGQAGGLALASLEELSAVVITRAPAEFLRRQDDTDGTSRWMQQQVVPFEDGVTITMRDVTTRVQADEAIQRARETAEGANRAKSDFVARMSHELRTPLNSVIGFTNILLKNRRAALDESDLQYLHRVRGAGTHLLALINDVLDIAKVEAGRMTLEKVRVEIVPLVRSVMAHLQPQAQQAGISLELESDEETAILFADPDKVRQVLINLMGNALKFTPSGGVTVRVFASGDDGSGAALVERIEVTDTGIGIPQDRLDAVFEAFEQSDSSTSRQYGGTGLGLSISRALCHAMGLTLSVRSEEGVGTSFLIGIRKATPAVR